MALVFPNNDPVAFMVAFYGCLLAEVVPVPIEVPLSRKVLQSTANQLSLAVAAALWFLSFKSVAEAVLCRISLYWRLGN